MKNTPSDQTKKNQKVITPSQKQKLVERKNAVLQTVIALNDGRNLNEVYLRDRDGHLWSYIRMNKCWKKYNNGFLAGFLVVWQKFTKLKTKGGAPTKCEFEDALGSTFPIPKFDPFSRKNPNYMIVNLRKYELRISKDGECSYHLHKPSSKQTHLLPHSYSSDFECPLFNAFLNQTFSKSTNPPEMVRHVFELLGYAMQNSRHLLNLIVLQGGTASGKSTLLKIFATLVGKKNMATCSTDRFVKGLTGKKSPRSIILHIADDVEKMPVIQNSETSKFKSAAQNKNIQHLNDVRNILAVWATKNQLSMSPSNSKSLKSVCVVPFANSIPKRDRYQFTFNNLWNCEGEGIITQALEGLKRLHMRGYFDFPEDCVLATERTTN
jgi:hypothetical protein